MSTQRIMAGFEDLTGKTFGTLNVVQMVCRSPLTWRVVCTRCNSSWNERHERIRYVSCRNSVCGRTVKPRTMGGLTSTGAVNVAIRSRDSESAREFKRENGQ